MRHEHHHSTDSASGVSTWPLDVAEEKSALGACLLGQAKEALELLTADDFSLSSHKEIFAAIRELVGQGELTIEVSLLATKLRRRGTLETVGGVAYLAGLDFGVVPERGIRSRRKLLHEFAERRRLLKMAETAMNRASDLSQPIAETKAWLLESLR